MQKTIHQSTRPDEAFKRQLLQTLPGIRPYSRQLTGNRQAAEDLVQDTALRALEKHYQWERGTNLVAWLRTIMRNRYFECCRKKQPIYAGDITVDHPNAVPRNAEQPICTELRETGQAIDRLDNEYRQVLEMVALDGTSYEDAATSLNVPIGTVRSRLSRARSALRADLESERRYPHHL